MTVANYFLIHFLCGVLVTGAVLVKGTWRDVLWLRLGIMWLIAPLFGISTVLTWLATLVDFLLDVLVDRLPER